MERETPGQRPRPNYGHPQDPDSLTVTVLVPENAASIVVFDDNAALKAAIVERGAVRLWVPETRPWSLTCRDAGRC